MGGDWSRLTITMYRWHAGEAWSAPLPIQAQINANDKLLAEANAIVNPVFAGETVSVG